MAELRCLIHTDPGLSQCALLRFFLHMCTKVKLDPEQVNDTRSISTHKNSIYTLLTITKPIIYCCRVIIVVSLKYLLKGRIKPQTSLSILHRKRQFIITKHSKWKQWIEFNYIHEKAMETTANAFDLPKLILSFQNQYLIHLNEIQNKHIPMAESLSYCRENISSRLHTSP